jgi:TolB-like protein/Tfp pilus assembly protein PilF
MSFIQELKRRNVARVAVLYVIAAWLLLQVTDVLSSLLPVPEWTGSLVVVLLILGFFPVVIFSWVYELTPDGLKREKDVDRSRSITGETGRKINVLIVVLLIATIGVVIADRFIPRDSPAITPAAVTGPVEEETGSRPTDPTTMAASKFAPGPSIAVLPFVNMSSDLEQEYFSDGLSEELLNLLAKVPDLRVASRTSAFSYKGKDVKIAEVAAELNVAHVLEGSVRKSGNKVRITAQLIDAREDVHLWSETWDRTLDDVFAIQDEIAGSVVEQLKVTLLGSGPKIEETDPEAYNLYLKAIHLGRGGTADGMFEAVDLFKRVLEIDPQYAPAWVGLSSAYTNLAGSQVMAREEGYELARQADLKALDVDPDNAIAHAGLGWVARVYDNDDQAAARYYEKALRLAPNNDRVLNGAAVMLQSLLRLDEAIDIYRILIERDPVNPSARHNLGVAYYSAGNMDAARASFDAALSLSPDMVLARWWRAYVYCVEEAFQDCLDAYESLADLADNEGFRVLGHAAAYAGLGREEDGARALVTLERDYGDQYAYAIASIHARLGNLDEAIGWIEREVELHGQAGLRWVKADPALRAIRDDPRMVSLIERSRMTDEDLARIEFDVDLPK